MYNVKYEISGDGPVMRCRLERGCVLLLESGEGLENVCVDRLGCVEVGDRDALLGLDGDGG